MCHLTFKQGQTLEQKHQKLYNPHGLALRASLLFFSPENTGEKLSLPQWGENKETEEYEISNPPGEFTPQ